MNCFNIKFICAYCVKWNPIHSRLVQFDRFILATHVEKDEKSRAVNDQTTIKLSIIRVMRLLNNSVGHEICTSNGVNSCIIVIISCSVKIDIGILLSACIEKHLFHDLKRMKCTFILIFRGINVAPQLQLHSQFKESI